MKMLTGFLTPTSGSASIFGCDIQTQALQAQRQMGYLPEGAPCYGDMTVMRSASPCDDEPREWTAFILGEETPRGETPLRQLPGENGLGLTIS